MARPKKSRVPLLRAIGAEIGTHNPQAQLAASLGVSIRSVGRMVKQLHAAGLIHMTTARGQESAYWLTDLGRTVLAEVEMTESDVEAEGVLAEVMADAVYKAITTRREEELSLGRCKKVSARPREVMADPQPSVHDLEATMPQPSPPDSRPSLYDISARGALVPDRAMLTTVDGRTVPNPHFVGRGEQEGQRRPRLDDPLPAPQPTKQDGSPSRIDPSMARDLFNRQFGSRDNE